MARLSRAEIEGRYTPELEAFIRETYAAELAKTVCRECGAHQHPDSLECKGRGKFEPGCGEKDNLSKLDHNEALQATHTETHAWLRKNHPELDSEAAWSLVQGYSADHGLRSDIGVVARAGLKHDHDLEQRNRDAKSAKMAEVMARLAAGVAMHAAAGVPAEGIAPPDPTTEGGDK